MQITCVTKYMTNRKVASNITMVNGALWYGRMERGGVCVCVGGRVMWANSERFASDDVIMSAPW